MVESVNYGQVEPRFSDRVIEDYETLIITEHGKVTNRESAEKQIEVLKSFEEFFDVVTIKTSADPLVTRERIRQAQGGKPELSIVAMGTGDGSTDSALYETLGNGALFYKLRAGNANNIGRACFQLWYRGNPELIFARGRIAKAKPIVCTVTDENGNPKYEFLALDEFEVGEPSAATRKLNHPDVRDKKESLGFVKRTLVDIKVSSKAALESPPFSVKWGSRDPTITTEQDERPSVNYRALAFSNIGHIAKLGRIKDIHMTDSKMVQLNNQSRSRLGSMAYYGHFFTGQKGIDIPDGVEIDFDVLTPTVMDRSGDDYDVAAGDHFHLSRSEEEVLVYTTRRKP